MALITPDLSEAPKNLEPGDYSARVMSGEVKEWTNGVMYVNWKLETFGADDPSLNGRTVWYSTNLSGKGVFTLQNLYKAAMGQDITGEFDTEHLVGKEVSVTLGEETDQNGNPRPYLGVKAVKTLR